MIDILSDEEIENLSPENRKRMDNAQGKRWILDTGDFYIHMYDRVCGLYISKKMQEKLNRLLP